MQRPQGACAVGGKQVSTLKEAARPYNVEIPVLVLEAAVQNSSKVHELGNYLFVLDIFNLSPPRSDLHSSASRLGFG